MNIIGMGVVGQALYNNVKYLRDITCYDLGPEFPTFTASTKIEESPVFICVGTPMQVGGKQDATALHAVLDALVTRNFKSVVIIKSTVLYKNIEPYFKKLKISISPEFLSARNATQDFYNTDYIVVGGTYAKLAAKAYGGFDFKNEEIKIEYCTNKEAIDFKYMRNIHQAYNVLFWEGIQDIMGNANKLASMLENIPITENSNISQDGYRGYGQSVSPDVHDFSACLDKDVCAKLHDVQEGKEHVMLRYIDNYNQSLC